MEKEIRTKLVCNLNLDDFFVYPHNDGTWRRTTETRTIRGKTYYVCKQLEEYRKQLLILGSERVELREKGGAA